MAVAKKRLGVFMPEHKATDVVGMNRDARLAFIQACIKEAEQEAKDYLDSFGVTPEQAAMIEPEIAKYLNENEYGQKVHFVNMPVLTTIVSAALLNSGKIKAKEVSIYAEKTRLWVRGDSRFHVKKGRGASGNGGVAILSRLTDSERKEVLGDDEELASAAQ